MWEEGGKYFHEFIWTSKPCDGEAYSRSGLDSEGSGLDHRLLMHKPEAAHKQCRICIHTPLLVDW